MTDDSFDCSQLQIYWYFCYNTSVWVRALCQVMPRKSISPRRIGIHGRHTSFRLEPEFWFYLRSIAAEVGMSATKLIEAINIARNPERSLSSALRVFIARHFYETTPHYGLFDPNGPFAIRLARPSKLQMAAAAVKASPNRSDRAIAKEIGASPTTIGKARKQLSADGQMEDQRRTGLDGKTRKMPERRSQSSLSDGVFLK
jgi:predicted DNA-binding ribbon-helix-helix protein